MVKIFDAGAENKVESLVKEWIQYFLSHAQPELGGHWPKFGHMCPPEHEYQVECNLTFRIMFRYAINHVIRYCYGDVITILWRQNRPSIDLWLLFRDNGDSVNNNKSVNNNIKKRAWKDD